MILLGLAPFSQANSAVVEEIKVEGLEKLSAGTVYNYLPIQPGDEVSEDDTGGAIRALFETGFFEMVKLRIEDGVVVVAVQERPTIANINILGNKKIKTKDIQDALSGEKLLAGRIYNRRGMKVISQSIEHQYMSIGRYNASVNVTEKKMPRNRVELTIEIVEGDAAKISKIELVGVHKESLKEVLAYMTLKEKPGLFDILSSQTSYNHGALERDLEKIKSFYTSRGYLDFKTLSKNVSLSRDKKHVFISIAVHEGEKFSFGSVSVESLDKTKSNESLRSLFDIKEGSVFSQVEIEEAKGALVADYADRGYISMDVRVHFERKTKSNEVDIVFVIDPGNLYYVREINISGNHETQDEVIRRELHQIEGSLYSARAVALSKRRLDLIGFFDMVSITPVSVKGSPDQVDLMVRVVEKESTGSFMLGGTIQDEVPSARISLNEKNVFGSGGNIKIDVQASTKNQTYNLNYSDHFYRLGFSRNFFLRHERRDFSNSKILSGYSKYSDRVGFSVGLPVAEEEQVVAGLRWERANFSVGSKTSAHLKKEIDKYNKVGFLVASLGYSHQSTDRTYLPTMGRKWGVDMDFWWSSKSSDFGILSLWGSQYVPLSSYGSLKFSGDINYGLSQKDEELPFFKRFYLGGSGGSGSLRGFETNSIATKVENDERFGGNKSFRTSLEYLFPTFGGGGDKNKRFVAFVDSGMVLSKKDKISFDKMRYSVGVAFQWNVPLLGPVEISYAFPQGTKPSDDVNKFQYSVGVAL